MKTFNEVETILRQRGEHAIVEVLFPVAKQYDGVSMETMRSYRDRGQVSKVEFEAFCYLWRNTVVRISSECEQFEL